MLDGVPRYHRSKVLHVLYYDLHYDPILLMMPTPEAHTTGTTATSASITERITARYHHLTLPYRVSMTNMANEIFRP